MVFLSKTLQSDTCRSRNFDIILDCTAFTSKSEVPIQWLKYCAEIIPADICMRFSTTRILNPNTLSQKYLRRLYNIFSGKSVYQCCCSCRLSKLGTPLCNEIKAYTSVLQLLVDVKTTAIPSLAFAGINFSFDEYPFMSLHNLFFQVSLEQDTQESFTDVNMKTSMRVPVELKVGSSHIRIISVSLQVKYLFSQKSD